ncbi:hypothetical protein TrispH2_005052 [Trichoplax sp. H2]|uniref:Male-enhanced antigen 1 n=1 Tax=Trichoplax adhaerens TaxID=10228 RepID=B3RZ39_TRIAD|nr:expressed protein [Trichoplax adhaerens]EDV24136.1 expressed protein [Trichoplax adhaerens]RDD43262.1 hypothetical protein TrispH2_005052 [Trichoplax sp. H2]|eukprot:XP_002113662.1 expressed protein [Trichoplax adhaerens]
MVPNDLPVTSNHENNIDSNENPVLHDEEDSDMDEEFDDDNQGYVPLGQDDDDQDELLTETPQSENGEGGMTTCMNANGQSNDHSHLHEPMNPAHAALIVQSMSNISLPLSATPDWAKLVPEEMWKESLLTTIAERHNQDDM